MEVPEVLAELIRRESLVPPGLVRADSEPIVSVEILRGWAESTGLGVESLLDSIALALARGYHESTLSFEQCDLIVNELFACATHNDLGHPDVFVAVFSAFDEGEHTHDNDGDADPEQIYTRPQIAQVLHEAGSSEVADIAAPLRRTPRPHTP